MNGIRPWGFKISVIALSSTEAEYIAAGESVMEALSLRQLYCDFFDLNSYCLEIMIDNLSAKHLSEQESMHSGRTKHIEVKYHFLRQHIRQKHIHLSWVNSENNLSDLMTKALLPVTHKRLCSHLFKEEC